MPGLNLFKRSSDKPRTSIRERLRNTAARILPRVRKARAGGGTDPARRAIVAGSLASAAVLPFPALAAAAANTDAPLLDTIEKFEAAMEQNWALNAKIAPLVRAALDSLPEHMTREEFQALPEDEQEAYREQRSVLYVEAWAQHGVTPLQDEQGRLFDTVIDPLKETIRNTAPTTVEGIAAKALYLLEHAHAHVLTTKDIDSLDEGEEDLRQFIEQLAALA